MEQVADSSSTAQAGRAATTTLVLMGVSGCGKSTVMRELQARLGWPSAEGDDFHSAEEVAKMHAGHALTDADRQPWLRALAAWIGQCEAAGQDALLTCSALRRSYRDLLRSGHPSVRFVHLAVSRAILEARIVQRHGHFFPSSLLASQLATLEPLADDEPGIVVEAQGSPASIADEVIRRLRLHPAPARRTP